ncbi:hypothetical protein SteCoe_9274 [Stentor coeruleus]|uniref:Uncharacterized protein n=1 Tax=Stentor coeruleus TaxID=5963 RepID=A0A1R2CIE9_9CILI|nr:hypothetical protein SteCoe_9274 [Stentor coeruleus]
MVPDKARDAVAEIRELTAADILCLKPPAWNKSTYVDRTKYYTDQLPLRKKKFEIHLGLQDFHELEPHANKIYKGTELRNNYTGWNVSTYFEQNELKKRLKNLTEKSSKATAKVSQKIQNYLKPSLSQTKFNEKLRDEKISDYELRNKIREQYLYECPKSSAEKTSAEVFKRILEYKLKVKQGEIANMNTDDETYRPSLNRNLVRNIEKKRVHDGVWMYSEANQKESWSCCMCEDFNAPGCIVKIRNKDRWITISL